MGLTLCSNFEDSRIRSFSTTEDFREEEDLEADDVKPYNRKKIVRSMYLIEKSTGLPENDLMPRSKSAGFQGKSFKTKSRNDFSLRKSMAEWNNRDRNRRHTPGECEAKYYQERLQTNTLKHVNDTVRVAESIVMKGADINEELARQEAGICRVNGEICEVEEEIDESTWKLKQMSLSGKFANFVRSKKPKLPDYNTFVWGSEYCADRNGDFTGRICATKSEPLKDYPGRICPTKSEPVLYRNPITKQQQIKGGISDLHTVLDTITEQQLDTAKSLQRQELQLNEFQTNLERTHEKMTCQTDVMVDLITD